MIAPTGFREYDARWKYPDDINLPGITASVAQMVDALRKIGLVTSLDPVIAAQQAELVEV